MKIKSELGYEIEIEKGIVKDRGLPKGFVITDFNVDKEYGYLIKNEKIVVEAGETSKSILCYNKIIGRLCRLNEEKIIAFGGGMIGDLAGFTASTYNRGIEFIQVPTTLLAMIDSSIGGKNGVNYGRIKNKVGTIYQPKKVLIDPLFLETLSNEEFKNGVAEIVKYGYLFRQPSLERLRESISKEDSDLEEVIYKCGKIKTKVVEKDVLDKNYRHILNLGHTVGHAIELLYELSHGEAISIGMVKELGLGEKIGIVRGGDSKKIRDILKKNDLPIKLPKRADIKKIIKNMSQDKKGKFVFALNKTNYNVRIDEETIIGSLNEI